MADYGDALAGLTYPSVLSRLGVDDPDELRGDKAKTAEVLSRLAGQDRGPVQVAQNEPPARPGAAPVDPRMVVPDDEPPNPTLRQRTPAPKPAPPSVPAVNQSGTSQPVDTAGAAGLQRGWQQDAAHQAVTGLLDVTNKARQNYEGEPEAPDTTTVDTRIENESTPTQLRDQNGKILKPYKEGFWGELGRVGHNFAAGYSGQMDKVTPYGAPNNTYKEDEELRQEKLALDEQRKKDVVDRFATSLKQRREQATDLKSLEPGYKDVGTMSVDAQKSQTEEDKQADEARRLSPEGQAAAKTAISEAEFKQYSSEADRLGLRGTQRTQYIGNKGKITDPRQATGEEIARAQALRTWQHEHPGDTPGLEDINTINAAAGGRLKDEGGDPVGSIVADQTGKKQEFIDQYDRQPDGSYLKKGASPIKSLQKQGDKMSGQEFNDKVEQFRLDANKALARHGAQIDNQGNVVRNAKQAAGGGSSAAPPGASAEVYDQHGKPAGHVVNGRFVPLKK